MDNLVKLFGWLCCLADASTAKDSTFQYGDLAPTQAIQHVRIGAFNIQRFGQKKFNDAFAIENLLKIISRYDLLLVQEVQDEEQEHIPGFIEKLNTFSGKAYEYVISNYLGRKTYKEQYMYIYRSDIFQIADKYEYEDGSEELGEDTFQREPFVVLVKSAKTAVGKFAIIGCHLTPSAVEQELNEMVNVHNDVIQKWGEVPVIMMGDFNAGGSHLSKRKLNNLELKMDEKYHWLLENVDTTVGKNEYTYDRIIISGDQLVNSVVPNTARAFNYEEEYGMTKEEAQKISDHYPVEFMMGESLKDEL